DRHGRDRTDGGRHRGAGQGDNQADLQRVKDVAVADHFLEPPEREARPDHGRLAGVEGKGDQHHDGHQHEEIGEKRYPARDVMDDAADKPALGLGVRSHYIASSRRRARMYSRIPRPEKTSSRMATAAPTGMLRNSRNSWTMRLPRMM